jgi:hypothetical protein
VYTPDLTLFGKLLDDLGKICSSKQQPRSSKQQASSSGTASLIN